MENLVANVAVKSAVKALANETAKLKIKLMEKPKVKGTATLVAKTLLVSVGP